MDTPTVKEVGLIVASSLLAAMLFFSYALIGDSLPRGVTLVVATVVIAALVWLALMALALALVRSVPGLLALIAVPLALTLLVGRLTIGAWGGALMLLVALVLARYAYERDRDRFVRFSTYAMFGRGTKLVMIGLIAALAGLALSQLEQRLQATSIRVSEVQVAALVSPFERVLNGIVPGLASDTTVDDLIDQELIRRGIAPASLSEEQRDQIRQQIEQQFDTPLQPDTTLAALIAERLNSVLDAVTRSNPFLIALVIIVLAFLAVRAVVPLLLLVVIGLLTLLVRAAVAARFLQFESVPANVVRIRL